MAMATKPVADGAGGKQPQRKPRGRPFAPGTSGNPGGRPVGSRSAVNAALDRVAPGRVDAIVERVVTLAEQGDLRAAELVLSRCWRPRRGAPVPIALPRIGSAADVLEAQARVVEAVATAAISPEEASAVQGVLEGARRIIETANLEARIEALEANR